MIRSVVEEGEHKRSLSQLEVLTDNIWVPVVTYEISDAGSLRHQYSFDGSHVSMPIDLPASAIEELVTNDLRSNWRNYYNHFCQHLPGDS
jgi:hypothetical protein